jgi:7-cyano-7-deazaguanine reductase
MYTDARRDSEVSEEAINAFCKRSDQSSTGSPTLDDYANGTSSDTESVKSTEPIEATVLGKTVGHSHVYDPDVLVAVPRIENRTQYDIDEDNLPFVGFDSWHAYEVSFMTKKGRPVSFVAKIVYSSDSECIVESKSLKLYLNSFNMMRYGKDKKEASDIVHSIITADLSKLLDTRVKVAFYSSDKDAECVFSDFPLLDDLIDMDQIEFTEFSESPELLKENKELPSDENELCFKSDLLRSNCKITSQPDWGTVFIHIAGESIPTIESIARFLVSFRREDHFHEEVVEMIYKRLYDKFEPAELMVSASYTRRGGIDICPSRATSIDLLDEGLINVDVLTRKEVRQ